MSPRVLFRLCMFFISLAIIATLALTPGATAQQLAGRMFVEDIDGDGYVNVMDVLRLVVLGRANPVDPRADYDGDGSFGTGDAALLCRNIMGRHLTSLDSPSLAWNRVGPGGGGGMFIPTVDPFDPSHALLACDMTGAYVTFDDGQNWEMFNLRTRVADFEFDPTSEGTVYAANTGLWRSEDGGVRWELVFPDPADVTYERMAGDHAEQFFETPNGLPDAELNIARVDPADGNHLYIGLQSSWYGPAKALVSDDRGASWRVLSALPGSNVLAMFPGSWWGEPQQVTVVTDEACVLINEATGDTTHLPLPDSPVICADGGKGESGAALYILTKLAKLGQGFTGGMYRSLDGGRTWTQIVNSLTNATETPVYYTFGVSQNNPETVYLSCESFPTNRQGVFKTIDSGDNWAWSFSEDWSSYLTHNFTESWLTKNYGHGYDGRPFGLGVGPNNPEVCFASSGRTYRTIDGGGTWQTVYSNQVSENAYTSRGLDVTTCYGVHFDPFDSLHMFTTYTDIGLFHSHDGGYSWEQAIGGITGGVRNTCYWLEFDPDVPGRIWSVWSNWHDLPRMKMYNDNWPNALGIPALSTNGGKSWVAKNYGVPGNAPHTHILLDPASPVESRTLYVCAMGLGVYKSTDGGNRWNDASTGLGENRHVWRITRAPDGALYLVVVRKGRESAVVPGALYRSRDNAATWENIPLPEGVSGPNDLAVDPSDPNRLYLSCWPQLDISVSPLREIHGGLYRSDDGGANWELVFDQTAHVYAAAIDPRHPSTVVIGTFDSAAFRSDDRGKTWYKLQGYDFKWGHRPVFDPHNTGMIYITSFGGGVFHGPSMGAPDATPAIMNGSYLKW